MTLTIKEKEHWKERISARIQKAIDHIYMSHAVGFKEDVRRQARQRVLERLGVKADCELADKLDVEVKSLQAKKENLRRRITDQLRSLGHAIHTYDIDRGVEMIISSQAELAELEVLSETSTGRAILRLKDEQEQLLDTVWLATSPVQIREL